MKLRFAALAILFTFGMLGTASAAVIGNFNLNGDACGGSAAGVKVTGTFIDWLPLGGGSGCIETGSGTFVSSAVGNLGPNVAGTIQDLPIGGPVVGFMTFASLPGLFFDLSSLGPGPANTACANSFDTNGAACSVGGPATPFKLTPNGTGTTVSLAAQGTARDGSLPVSVWSGSFSTDFAGLTPFDIQEFFLGIDDGADGKGCVIGTCTSTYAGRFTVTVSTVPEPGTMLFIGAGLIGLAGLRRKRKA